MNVRFAIIKALCEEMGEVIGTVIFQVWRDEFR